ncbi:winged helix-turn-helix domain-containing protein [Microbacterium chocolatum]|uniref:ArsR/SmtB family transcription factor n=1 Tax=Microbacterium aurantiacum TaxID=162393 RepID=UPI00338E2C4D
MTDDAFDDADAEALARSRALSSPLRMRILRLCRFESRTNKELAALLDVNPGTMLHHVRTLTQTGFLAAEEPRSGTRGAREIPYRATGLSWRTPVPGGSLVLVETFLQQIEGLDPDDIQFSWLGLKLNAANKAELDQRVYDLLTEFAERGPDADGDPYSLVVVTHPDVNPASQRDEDEE